MLAGGMAYDTLIASHDWGARGAGGVPQVRHPHPPGVAGGACCLLCSGLGLPCRANPHAAAPDFVWPSPLRLVQELLEQVAAGMPECRLDAAEQHEGDAAAEYAVEAGKEEAGQDEYE